jgi:hypothetical protein
MRPDSATNATLAQKTFARPRNSASAAPRRLDRPDVDLLHGHHRIKSTLCLITACRERFGQDARCDLPGQTPLVLAPATVTFATAIADNGVPVAVGFFLVVGCDLK